MLWACSQNDSDTKFEVTFLALFNLAESILESGRWSTRDMGTSCKNFRPPPFFAGPAFLPALINFTYVYRLNNKISAVDVA